MSDPSSLVRVLDEVEEDVARLEDAGVVREQAEHDPHQKSFQIVAPVARRVERIVQPSDQFGRRDIGGVLVAECPALHAENEAEFLDVGGQVRERKDGDFALVEIAKLEGLKIADQNEAGAVALRQRVEILPGLAVGLVEIAPGAFLLDDQDAGPEQVDEARAVVQLPHMLFVACNGTSLHPEYRKEIVIEALGLALLVGGIPPLPGESGGANAHLVP